MLIKRVLVIINFFFGIVVNDIVPDDNKIPIGILWPISATVHPKHKQIFVNSSGVSEVAEKGGKSRRLFPVP